MDGDGALGLQFNCARLFLEAIQVRTPAKTCRSDSLTSDGLSPTSAAGSMTRRFRRHGWQECPNSDQGPAAGDHASSAYNVLLGWPERSKVPDCHGVLCLNQGILCLTIALLHFVTTTVEHESSKIRSRYQTPTRAESRK